MEPRNESKQQAPAGLERQGELAGLRILIVEDAGVIVLELRTMLEKLDCVIAGVASRLDDATTLAQTTENLGGVLLDLNLSGESAYPVAEILHERGIPFIIMSGYDTGHIRADCADEAYLQKPFGYDDLARMMQRTFLPSKCV